MIKLLKKYGVELKLKKCDLFRLIEGQKDTFLEDGFAFKMTNEEEMFKYEVILNGIYNKTKIEGEYKKFVYETQDAIQYLNYEDVQLHDYIFYSHKYIDYNANKNDVRM